MFFLPSERLADIITQSEEEEEESLNRVPQTPSSPFIFKRRQTSLQPISPSVSLWGELYIWI